jgi:hypothetical protein
VIDAALRAELAELLRSTPGPRLRYAEVHPDAVPPLLYRAVRDAVRAAAGELGLELGRLCVRWFAEGVAGLPATGPASDDALWGCVRADEPETLWLACNLPLDRAAELARHEVRHCWQRLCAPDLFDDEALAERDARVWSLAGFAA